MPWFVKLRARKNERYDNNARRNCPSGELCTQVSATLYSMLYLTLQIFALRQTTRPSREKLRCVAGHNKERLPFQTVEFRAQALCVVMRVYVYDFLGCSDGLNRNIAVASIFQDDQAA